MQRILTVTSTKKVARKNQSKINQKKCRRVKGKRIEPSQTLRPKTNEMRARHNNLISINRAKAVLKI